jgi:hypothetical protein
MPSRSLTIKARLFTLAGHAVKARASKMCIETVLPVGLS